jgi:hypothetical protein
LGAKLSDTKQTGCAFEFAELFATSYGGTRRRNSKNVCKTSGGRSNSQKYKIRRNAFGGAPRNNAIVLRKIGYKNAEQEDAMISILVPRITG